VDAALIRNLDANYVLGTYRRQAPLFVRGEGVWMFDSDGNRYLDLLAGIAVDQLGHAHPAMIETIERQGLSHAIDTIGLREGARFLQRAFGTASV